MTVQGKDKGFEFHKDITFTVKMEEVNMYGNLSNRTRSMNKVNKTQNHCCGSVSGPMAKIN
jgi:hypothetical protein